MPLFGFNRLLERIAWNDPSPRQVDLIGERIGDDGAKRLAEALRDNTFVTELWLQYSGIGDVGARALADMLKGNSSITNIYLQSNITSSEGARVLAEALHQSSSISTLSLQGNSIGDAGARELMEMLQINSSVTNLSLWNNGVSRQYQQRVRKLIKINNDAPNPEDARRLKVLCKVEWWLIDSKVDAETAAAVDLALDQLGSFPKADERRSLFEEMLGSTERGAEVAASLDMATARTLYRYAADCGAAPVVLMHLLRAHPSLCACRDVRHGLFPFMLLATMAEAGAGDVLELLLLNPNLIESGIDGPV